MPRMTRPCSRLHGRTVGHRSGGGVIRALLFGNDLTQNEWVTEALQSSGHEVVACASGSEVPRELIAGRAIALVECGARYLDSLELVRSLDPACARRVLLIAWRPSWSTVRQFIEAGVGDFLRMPASQAELLLRTALRARAVDVASHLERDPRAAPSVELSPRERRLYDLLAARAGSAVSRDEIRAHVWGRDHAKLSSNIVEVYVRYVRTKLANAASTVTIRTVPRVGYMLE